MLKDRNKKLAAIHIAKKELQLNEEAYRALLSRAGIYSASEIKIENQYKIIMQGFKNLGYTFKKEKRSNYSFKNQRSGGGKDRLTKKQEYYIRGLWDLASRVKDEKSLNALILRIGKVIDISHLTVFNASKVILALRDICKKAGFNPDSKYS
ncbi:phage protein GemA/Gp16 family protein [Treponema putidum]|uniref:DUF1018 domain-containing protein n=1 Tax=Treponema putidum TaxID=221027 RepID=A0ABY5HTR7_9SPIR|nr:phage protein GemA/Gp16 family protein [Treponema putidum]UTY27571.1 DUF1018 domain-containing protein [Treponema putidum]